MKSWESYVDSPGSQHLAEGEAQDMFERHVRVWLETQAKCSPEKGSGLCG